MKSQSIHNKNYSIEIYSGTVTDFSQRSETHVSGSGSQGSVEINSQVTNHLRFFLVDENGVEKDFQITNWDFPMRVGHQIKLCVLFSSRNSQSGTIVALKKLNSNYTSINEQIINEFTHNKYKLFAWLGKISFFSILFFIMALSTGTFDDSILDGIIKILWGFGWIIFPIYYFIQTTRLSSQLNKELNRIL